MAASKMEISAWFDDGLRHRDAPTHMLVVCDTYDYEDFPVYVKPTENAREVFEQHNGKNMQRVMEVYDLSKDKDVQLNTSRVMNF